MDPWWCLRIPKSEDLKPLEEQAVQWACRHAVRRDRVWRLCLAVLAVWFCLMLWWIIKVDSGVSTLIGAVLAGAGALLPCGRAIAITRQERERFLAEHDGKVEPDLVIQYLRRRCLGANVFGIVSYAAFAGVLMLALTTWAGKVSLEIQASFMASQAGDLQAERDFRDGMLRLYELGEGFAEKSTGRKEGPFEIWTRPSTTVFGGADKRCLEEFVDSYNERMRSMHRKENPDTRDEPD